MKKKSYAPFFMLLIFLAVLFIVVYFGGFSAPVLNPKGLIAFQERKLIIISTLLMLIVVIPVFILTFFISWKYRASNEKAKYSPEWDYNRTAEIIWWGIPCIIILILAVITWNKTQELDPLKPLEMQTKPITIQVVALQWKWLFIYPEQKIATVNFVQFPSKTPVHFNLTADAPMNSFWIPALSGQIFAMPKMVTQLHLIADEDGSYRGSSANISGEGFAGMTFIAKSSSVEDFDQWVDEVKQSQISLGSNEYDQLAKPSEYNAVSYYVLKEDALFDQIVMKYMMPPKEDH